MNEERPEEIPEDQRNELLICDCGFFPMDARIHKDTSDILYFCDECDAVYVLDYKKAMRAFIDNLAPEPPSIMSWLLNRTGKRDDE